MIKYFIKIIKIRKERKMDYETATYLLNKISEIQEVLIQKPPVLPTNFGYIISRIFLYAIILFFWILFFSL